MSYIGRISGDEWISPGDLRQNWDQVVKFNTRYTIPSTADDKPDVRLDGGTPGQYSGINSPHGRRTIEEAAEDLANGKIAAAKLGHTL